VTLCSKSHFRGISAHASTPSMYPALRHLTSRRSLCSKFTTFFAVKSHNHLFDNSTASHSPGEEPDNQPDLLLFLALLPALGHLSISHISLPFGLLFVTLSPPNVLQSASSILHSPSSPQLPHNPFLFTQFASSNILKSLLPLRILSSSQLLKGRRLLPPSLPPSLLFLSLYHALNEQQSS
jgi:hypothetical protein